MGNYATQGTGISMAGIGAVMGTHNAYDNLPAARRTLFDEYQDAVDSLNQVRPDMLAGDREFLPQQQALNMDLLRSGVVGLADILREYGSEGEQLEGLKRREALRQDLGILDEFSGAMRDSLRAANPENARLYDLMNEQVTAELASGNSLSPQEQHSLMQMYRGAASDRGFGMSPRDAKAEALGLFAVNDDRQKQRRADAAALMQMSELVNGNPAYLLGRPTTSNAELFGNAMGSWAGGPGYNLEHGMDVGTFNENAKWARQVNRQQIRAGNSAMHMQAGAAMAGSGGGGYSSPTGGGGNQNINGYTGSWNGGGTNWAAGYA